MFAFVAKETRAHSQIKGQDTLVEIIHNGASTRVLHADTVSPSLRYSNLNQLS